VYHRIIKGIGLIATVLTVVATASVLYERAKRPALTLRLEQTISGYFLRVVNSGNANCYCSESGIRVLAGRISRLVAMVISISRHPATV
jgi:hypothetical protein